MSIDTREERLARRIADLYTNDRQFADGRPSDAISAAIDQPERRADRTLRTRRHPTARAAPPPGPAHDSHQCCQSAHDSRRRPTEDPPPARVKDSINSDKPTGTPSITMTDTSARRN